MRIGLIGWYGHGNAGDERILFCLQRFFEGHELLVTSSFPDAMARLADLNTCDFVMLGGGGLIIRGTGQFAGLIEQLEPRFGCVGISIESLHADNMRMIEALKERAEFILVRDLRSRDLLDCHFKTIVGPDLTFLYPYEITTSVESDVCGFNLRPWRFWAGEHNGAFDRIMRRINHRLPSLTHIYPFMKWEPEKVVSVLKCNFKNIVPLPLYLEDSVENDWDALAGYFPEVPAAYGGKQLDGCRFFVGMRLHGLIFACQKGIPFLSLSYQPKNEEFCTALGLSEFSVNMFNLASLEKAIDKLKSAHAEIRSTLLDIRADYHQEIKAIMGAIKRLVIQP